MGAAVVVTGGYGFADSRIACPAAAVIDAMPIYGRLGGCGEGRNNDREEIHDCWELERLAVTSVFNGGASSFGGPRRD